MIAKVRILKRSLSLKVGQLIGCKRKFHLPIRKEPHNFVTTPIFYVNAEPHIGHLHSLLVADAFSRYQRLRNPSSSRIFSTGCDEHGMKIEQAARNRKTTPQDLCDQVSVSFQHLSREFDINFTRFIRTTDVDHKEVAQSIWSKLMNKGFIYKSKYEGWYSISDECFATRTTEVTDAKTGETVRVTEDSGNLVEWYTEENYMFRLSNFIDPITKWLETKPEAVIPNKFRQVLLKSLLSGEIKDLSISRPRERLWWGIPVPGDESHTIYVWMEALFNYLTVGNFGTDNFLWPPVHVVGKDILKFHAVYWPAFLMALNLELPSKLVCHSHWTIDGIKMSKSKGNVIDPFKLKTVYGKEAIRYFMLREAVLEEDATFNETEMIRTVNNELSDTFGNLLSRCTSSALNVDQEFPERPNVFSDSSQECLNNLLQLPHDCLEHFENCRYNCAVDLIMKFLRSVNHYIQEHKPWVLKKEGKKDELKEVIYVCLESVRVSAILLSPIIPDSTEAILNKLNCPPHHRILTSLSNKGDNGSHKLSKGSSNIFPRMTLSK